MATDRPPKKKVDQIKYIILTLLSVGQLHCQNVEDMIKKTSIECKDLTAPNQNIYAVLKNFKVICLGEMHGTKEPAEFLIGLTKTFISNKRTVILGLEIPEKLMTQFHKQRDSIGLSQTNFFTEKTVDGRGSEAWFRTLNECNKLGVKFCFFDNSNSNRDLGMYEKLIDCYQADTNAVLLTLSGNVHNRIVPFNDAKTMGCYLKERFGNKVCSINHTNNGGTMFSRTSKGLKVHTIEPTDGIFSTSTMYDNYYLPNIFNITEYSGFLYTKTMTASLPRTK
jgi:hypothetical protein